MTPWYSFIEELYSNGTSAGRELESLDMSIFEEDEE